MSTCCSRLEYPSAGVHLPPGKFTGTIDQYFITCNLRVLNTSLKYVPRKSADLLIFFFLYYYYRRNGLKAGRCGKDVMRILFLSLLIAASLVSCNAQRNIKADFEKNVKKYNESVRWHQFESASLFPADAISGEYRERVMAAKNVEVIDYRLVDVKYDEKKNEAEVKVEIDYTPSLFRIRTIVDNQKWAYQEKEGIGLWRLISLLPEFP
jgi:hypothetical protein